MKLIDFKEGGENRKYITAVGILPEVDEADTLTGRIHDLIYNNYTMNDEYLLSHPEPTAIEPFHFINTGDDTVTISLFSEGDSYRTSLDISTDNENWVDWTRPSDMGAQPIDIPASGKLYIKSTDNVGYFNNSEEAYNYFTSTGNINVGGSIMSLGYKDYENQTTITQQYAYSCIFRGMDNLIYAKDLILPATTLAPYCYTHMFSGCYAMIQGPDLLTSTLTPHCYQYMFENCVELIYIKMLATDILGDSDGCLTSWVVGTYQTDGHTFVKKAGVDIERGSNGIPEEWDVIEI